MTMRPKSILTTLLRLIANSSAFYQPMLHIRWNYLDFSLLGLQTNTFEVQSSTLGQLCVSIPEQLGLQVSNVFVTTHQNTQRESWHGQIAANRIP